MPPSCCAAHSNRPLEPTWLAGYSKALRRSQFTWQELSDEDGVKLTVKNLNKPDDLRAVLQFEEDINLPVK